MSNIRTTITTCQSNYAIVVKSIFQSGRPHIVDSFPTLQGAKDALIGYENELPGMYAIAVNRIERVLELL